MQTDTVAGAYTELRRRFRAARIVAADLDARLIVQHSLELTHADILARPDLIVSDAARQEIASLAGRREAGEPISRLFGERDFYGRAFRVTRNTFDPRPDTETLVEAALEAVMMRRELKRWRILELGTGTGAVVVSLLATLQDAQGIATDICPHALAVARRNAICHAVDDRLSFHSGSWFDGLDGAFDLIVANPPYLRTDDIDSLAPEVRNHDPTIALDGGPDGLDAYRQIAGVASKFIASDGLVMLEVGYGQKDAVVRIMNDCGYKPPVGVAGTRCDLHGIERVVTFGSGKSALGAEKVALG